MCNKLALGALATLVAMGPGGGRADDAPPYASATEAYRLGVNALKSDMPATAVPALEYAAKRGVLGAQIKLARAYASGRDLPKDDAKAFTYFQLIADQQAEVSPRSPLAKYAAEAFVALGQYYLSGIPEMKLAANPAYAAHLFRHAASYFGNAEAQYQLARLYMDGEGVEKNVGLAINWLATAAKKQHVASQATLGEILWRGEEGRQRRARGLALIILAHENAAAAGKEPEWIGNLYQEAVSGSDKAIREDAAALLPELGGAKAAEVPPLPTQKALPAGVKVMPAAGTKTVAAPAPSTSAEAVPLGQGGASPPAPIGLPVGFGATDAGSMKP
ncbi:MAG TPA: tetratricopeptide repeat protein [Methyloceanibacter sp.]|nr:tetratricopeptide repeat protein [Methyloceanibacter sp.]